MKRAGSTQRNNGPRPDVNGRSSVKSAGSNTFAEQGGAGASKASLYDTLSLKNLAARLNAAQEPDNRTKPTRKKPTALGAIGDKVSSFVDDIVTPSRKKTSPKNSAFDDISNDADLNDDNYYRDGQISRAKLSDTQSLAHLANTLNSESRERINKNPRLYETQALYNLRSVGSGNTRKRIKKKKSRKKPIIIISIIIVLILALGIGAYAYMFGGMKRTVLDEEDLGIDTNNLAAVDVEKLEGIVNIALFGIDTTDGAATIGDQYRSDCIIILSIDTEANDFKVTSILRDSKVPIEGYSPQKINSAYKYGGAKLAIKTLNQNFKMNIKDYVTVDFARMAEIIDLVGGLTIKITDAEAKNMMENNIIDPVSEGTRLLDGAQCVAYARVRKVDSDYFRASRQQQVLTLLFEKIKKKPKTEYPALIRSMLKCVETSMSYDDFIKIINSMDLSKAKMVKNTIPDPNFEKNLRGGVDSTGSWVWEYNLDSAASRLHNIIYGTPYKEEAYVPPSNSGSNSSSNSGNQIEQFFGGGEVQPYIPPQDETIYQEEELVSEVETGEVVPDETGDIVPVYEDPTTAAPDPGGEEPQTDGGDPPAEGGGDQPPGGGGDPPAEGGGEQPPEGGGDPPAEGGDQPPADVVIPDS